MTNLNPYDTESVLSSIPSMDAIKSSRYLTVINSIEAGFKWKNTKFGSYVKNAPLISLANWKSSDRYCKCGIPGSSGFRNTCNLTRFCCYCSWKKAEKLYHTLAPAYLKSSYWTHMTVAYRSNLPLTSSKEDYLNRYNLAFKAVQSLISDGYIDGAVAVADLSIPSLAGQMVFPHVHILMCSSQPMAQLSTSEPMQLHPSLSILTSNPELSINIRLVEDDMQFKNICRYPVKAIDLKHIYESDLSAGYTTEQINNGTDLLLQTLSVWEHKYIKIRYFGILKPGTKSFIGKKKD